MNSIRPFATVTILAVIGVGLYMIINTSEPIPPEEAADAMLDVPEIEDDLAGLLEPSDPSPYAEAGARGAFAAGDDLTEPPAWSPPPANSSPGLPNENGYSAPPSLPKDAPPYALPRSAADSLRAGDPRTQVPPAPNDWDSIPRAEIAEQLVESLPYAGAGAAGSAHSTAEPIQAATSSAATPFSVVQAAVEDTLRRGDLSQGLLMLSEYYGDPQLTPNEQEELADLLNQLAGTVIYSTQHELEAPHRMQPGETLEMVATRYGVTAELLAKINGVVDPHRLTPGTELKVLRGPFHAIHDAEGLRLTLDGRYAGRFPAQGPTAWSTDAWTVRQKLPAGSAFTASASGSGKQILLTPADASGQPQAVAIVADTAPGGADQAVIRVSTRDLDDLYDILTVGSRVTIRR